MTMPEQVTRIAINVTAAAASTAISGWRDQCLRVRLSSAPERGKANAALIALLAKSPGLPRSVITIIRGQRSAHKTIQVEGLPQADIIARLHAWRFTSDLGKFSPSVEGN